MNLLKRVALVSVMTWNLVAVGQSAKAAIAIPHLDTPSIYFHELKRGIEKNRELFNSTSDINSSRLEQMREFSTMIDSLSGFSAKLLGQLDQLNDKGGVLNGNQLTILHRTIGAYLVLTSDMLQLAAAVEPADLKNIDDELISNSIEYTKKNLIWLSVHLDLVHGVISGFGKVYLENGKLRRLMNDEDISYDIRKNQLKGLLKEVSAKKYQKTLRKGLEKFDDSQSLLASLGQLDKDIVFLTKRIAVHKAKKKIQDKKIKKFRRKMRWVHFKDGLKRAADFTVHHVSGLFGNTMGAVKFRRGYMDKDEELNNQILAVLRPLDMITEKTPFILTDKFIPGHFGHNAIWLGTEEQLKEIGMWNHPKIIPLQNAIKSGFNIIESDRAGTHLKSLELFMNVDEFMIFRKKDVLKNKDYVAHVYDVATRQLGKTYDFNFDVETTNRLVCSELLYQSIDTVLWPTEPYLGRTTISPDNVGETLLKGETKMEIVFYKTSTAKKKYKDKTLADLAIDLGYRQNEDKSTADYPYFEKPMRKCRSVKVKRKIFGGYKTKKICGTRWIHQVWQEPYLIEEAPDIIMHSLR